MNPRSLCAIVLALALPAFGQTELQIEPLVPPGSAPTKTKKKSKAPKKAPPSDGSQAEGQLSLPPLAPLTAPRPLKSVGVLVNGTLPVDTAARVREGLRAAAVLAPGVKETVALEAPAPCANEACWVTAGLARNVDHVLQCRAAVECALACALDHGSISNRIGKRHPEFKNVDAGIDRCDCDLFRCGEIGITAREVCDQRRL